MAVAVRSELLGARVEVGRVDPRLTGATVDIAFPGGLGRLLARSERAVLSVARVGAFAVEHGRRIVVEPHPEATARDVSQWLHGTVAALLLAQRGAFALHASVVAIRGAAVAVTGPRTVGKSTTVLRLSQRGHALVADDVSPLVIGDDVEVRPFARPVHLADATARRLELCLTGADRDPGKPKLALPGPAHGPVPLRHVVVLRPARVDAVASARLHGADAHLAVAANLYRASLLRPLAEQAMFAWAATVAARVPVHLVTRPGEKWTIDAVADAVEAIAATP